MTLFADQYHVDRAVPGRPGVEQEPGNAPPGSTPSTPVRAQVANFQAEVAWRGMFDTELAMHDFAVEQAPPYYQGGPGTDTIPRS